VTESSKPDTILVIDFGSQLTQLIARRVREQNVYSEVHPCTTPLETLKAVGARGIILSGGPSSSYAGDAPTISQEIFTWGIPILGICYGMQLGCQLLGGKVQASREREFGRAELVTFKQEGLFADCPGAFQVWMSHGDRVEDLDDSFLRLGKTTNSPMAAIRHKDIEFYGIQFHPEVTHTQNGNKILSNFIFRICGARANWTRASFIEQTINDVRAQVGENAIVCGLSGGVDSSVVAALLHRAIGDQLHCIFVNNGLLREGEVENVVEAFQPRLGKAFHLVDASDQFLSELSGVSDPETKRKIIGRVFIDVFKEAAKSIPNAHFLAQGTLYPDVIESVSPFGGPSATIKSHHNVGGLPAELGFDLVEPLRMLFKDEARAIGLELGLPERLVWRHPVPGPGLAIRCLGDLSPERLAVLRQADAIARRELWDAGYHRKTWQAFVVLLPVKSVGVMGDGRTYEDTACIRSVDSVDGMTADWSRIDYDTLAKISNRIINEVKGVNRVVYDISSKPPSTIEWE
jgi:GMP synthase (glutamine-hydrolysing)